MQDGIVRFKPVMRMDGVLSTAANILYVAKNGSDNSIGSASDPFFTIGAAMDYAITLLNPTPDGDEAIVIQVAPGKYTEKLTQAHRRVFIVGAAHSELENWEKDVIIYNTGLDDQHYPIDVGSGLNLMGIQVAVDSGGVFGRLINKGFYSTCFFQNGHFITNAAIVGYLSAYYNFCYFDGPGFKLEDTDTDTFVALRNCDLDGTGTVFSSTATTTNTLKLENTMLSCDLTIAGDWNFLMQWSEIYNMGTIDFDTDGYVDIFSSIIVNGIHFTTDTALSKKLVNCLFRNITADTGDVTADVPVEFIEYSGNHQDNGIDGEIITVSKIKNVGGGQNMYRNIHEALQGSTLQDTIINLEGDVAITDVLVIPPNVDIQIDGNKKWKLTTTHATTLVTLGANQTLSFVNMKQVVGGKLAIVNADNAALSFVSCGRYTEPNYVNIEINAGNATSFVYLVKTTLIGTSAPVIEVNDIDVLVAIDRSFLKGASGNPAIGWTVDADSKSKFKYSTFLHGDGAGNSPFLNSDPGNGDITFSLYNCAMNATYPAADFTNSINPVNANLTVDSGIDF